MLLRYRQDYRITASRYNRKMKAAPRLRLVYDESDTLKYDICALIAVSFPPPTEAHHVPCHTISNASSAICNHHRPQQSDQQTQPRDRPKDRQRADQPHMQNSPQESKKRTTTKRGHHPHPTTPTFPPQVTRQGATGNCKNHA